MAKSRPQRWSACIDRCRSLADDLKANMEELEEVRSEYEEWKDNLPENMESSTLGEKLEEVCNLEIDTDSVVEIETMLDEAEGIDLPLGFGRD